MRLAGLWFSALAVVLTWPAAARLSTHVPGAGAGDNMMFLWNIWWMREAVGGGASFFEAAALFAPVGVDLVQHTHTALAAFAGATVLGALTVPAAVNVTIIASYTLNGMCAWLLARHVARDRLAAIVAGTYFAAAPYFAGHLLGHFNLAAAWVLPLFLLALIGAIESGSPWRAAAAGLVLAAAAYADYYYLAYLGVLLAVFVAWQCLTVEVRLGARRPVAAPGSVALLAGAGLCVAAAVWIAATGGGEFTVFGAAVSARSGRNLRTAAWILFAVWGWRRTRPRLRIGAAPLDAIGRALRVTAIALGILALGAAPLIVRAAALWHAGDYAAPPYFWLSAPAGIDVASLVAGNPFHPLWGGAVRSLYDAIGSDPVERAAWLGLVPLMLLLAGASRVARLRGSRFWIAIAVVFFVWALGPRLTVAGADTGLVLPATVIRFVPLLSNVRMPARAIVVVYLAVGVLLALWWAERRRSPAAAWVLTLVILVDFMPAPVPTTRLPAPGVYAELAGRPAGAVLELPLGLRDGFGQTGFQAPETMYYQTLHGRPITGGAVARLPERVRRVYRESAVLGPLLRLSAGEEVPADLRALSAADFTALGIRYVVFDRATAPAALGRFLATSMPVRPIAERDGRELYVIE